MKVCVLQSHYDTTGDDPPDTENDPMRPGNFTDLHEFHERWIHKATAKAEIDAVIGEGYDLFFNFLWGLHEDNVAGIDAVKYLEFLKVPFMGQPSRVLEWSKVDFYREAVKVGLRIPETSRNPTKFPVIVKPGKGYASLHLDDKAVCWNMQEVEAQVALLRESLAAGVALREKHRADSGDQAQAKYYDPEDDIVVQEFVDGKDYALIIIEMNGTPLVLTPSCYKYPEDVANKANKFLTFDIKFNPELQQELFDRSQDPELFDKLHDMALEVWKVYKMEGSQWGHVDIRVRHSDGELVAIEANPMPTVFVESHLSENGILESFPGGTRSVIDVLIESTLARHGGVADALASRANKIAETYNGFVGLYLEASNAGKFPDVDRTYKEMQERYDFTGLVLDVACGFGLFPRMFREKFPTSSSTVFHGIDLSSESVKAATLPDGTPLFEKVYIGPMQEILPPLKDRSYDHVYAFLCLHFIPPTQLSAVLARMFHLAKRSVMWTIDQLPEVYNEDLRERGEPHMVGYNHLAYCETFPTPRGWRKIETDFNLKWESPKLGIVVPCKVYRYEAL